ncbi:MAG TPA: zinc dependent phospholipase C family protein, partial [Methanobacteriaceae archaeon]|nr:zinc dependent phospholipase C family protein [Methanobacteriaceae archaeon]
MKNFLRILPVLMVDGKVLKLTWKAHASVIDAAYNALPTDMKKNLDKAAMEDGSNDPDQIFHDYVNHHYPASYKKAQFYLDKGKKDYKNKKYKKASKNFGIASHYITDNFSAPHCVSKESDDDHHDYEVQAEDLQPIAIYIPGKNLKTIMEEGYQNGADSWKSWKESKK